VYRVNHVVYNCGRALTGFGDPGGNPVVAVLIIYLWVTDLASTDLNFVYIYMCVCERACVRACVRTCKRAGGRACVCVWKDLFLYYGFTPGVCLTT